LGVVRLTGLVDNLEHHYDPAILHSLHGLYHSFVSEVVPHFRVMDADNRLSSVLWDTSTNGEFSVIWQVLHIRSRVLVRCTAPTDVRFMAVALGRRP
jgi:hypothetical protein